MYRLSPESLVQYIVYTYICRVQSCVWRLPKYWPTTPLHPASASSLRTKGILGYIGPKTRELGLNDFDEDKSKTRAIGMGGPWKSRLFWAQRALASLVAISGPKKISIFRAHSFQCPQNECCPQKNHFVLPHINNRYINSYSHAFSEFYPFPYHQQ